MKIGLKLYPDKLCLIEKFNNMFDFFEIMVTPDLDLDLLHKARETGKMITIHAPHHDFGFDPGDRNLAEQNTALLQKAIKAAEIVDSPWIIVHSGLYTVEKKEECMQSMADFFRFFDDPRIIIENCPSPDMNFNGDLYLISTPKDAREFLSRFEHIGLLLDFGHAICTANLLEKNPYPFIEEFMALKPRAFHLSGIDIASNRDEHKHLFEVDNDFCFLKKLSDEAFVTFETSMDHITDPSVHIKNINLLKPVLGTH